MLPISAENRSSAGVAAGDEVDVDIELDTEPREVTLPPDFAGALDRDADAKQSFDGLSHSHKQRHVLSIEQAKDNRDAATTHHQSTQHAARGPKVLAPALISRPIRPSA
jgi:uncharacterized protein YdeI (YjbR/CyaY-like superfamily)